MLEKKGSGTIIRGKRKIVLVHAGQSEINTKIDAKSARGEAACPPTDMHSTCTFLYNCISLKRLGQILRRIKNKKTP